MKKSIRVYVDMDGVLTDFAKSLCKLLDIPLDRNFTFKNNDTKVWKKIDDAGEEFWADMDWMPKSKEFWDSLSTHNPIILSAPSNHKSSIYGKKTWINKNLGSVPFILDDEKEKYASPNSILIDDREKNITKWIKEGGIGILHTSNKKTLKELEEYLEKEPDWVGEYLK